LVMAVGKNKKTNTKGGRRGGRKKIVDPFARKEWYEVRAPSIFPMKVIGKTLATKTTGQKIARDSLMGRVFEVSLGDLKPESEDEAFRKFRLKVEDVNGKNCLTNFYGMDITTDKLRSLVKKWQTLIEAFVDVKTTDGYTLRMFCIGFTQKQANSKKLTAYAQTRQVKRLRKKMVEVMQKETANVDLHGLVDKLMSEIFGREIEKKALTVYPLHNVLIRKVKMLKAPKVDLARLLEIHGGAESLSQGAPEPVKKLDLGQPVGEGKKGKKGKAAKGKKGAEEEEEEEEAAAADES